MFAQIAEPLSLSERLRQIPWLGWYVSMSGAPPGVAIVLMGSALLGWGLLNLRTRNRRAVVIHLGLCWLPVFVGMLCCGRALNEAMLPGMNAQTIMIGFMTGVAGPIAGLLPALLAIIQLWRLESME